ncbi:MAG: hypothetical protein R6U61_05655 [Thermoplasmata archaeon]
MGFDLIDFAVEFERRTKVEEVLKTGVEYLNQEGIDYVLVGGI